MAEHQVSSVSLARWRADSHRRSFASLRPPPFLTSRLSSHPHLECYRISPANSSGFISMNSAIRRPRTIPNSVPAPTPRQNTFCSPFVISHLQVLCHPTTTLDLRTTISYRPRASNILCQACGLFRRRGWEHISRRGFRKRVRDCQCALRRGRVFGRSLSPTACQRLIRVSWSRSTSVLSVFRRDFVSVAVRHTDCFPQS